MIALSGNRGSQIPAAYWGEGKKMADKKLLVLKKKGPPPNSVSLEFDTKFWSKAKPCLKKESNNKCASCEAPTALVAHGDVEHYRPKSLYWWLAYTYDNYLYACQICNQVHKKDKFPTAGPTLTGKQVTAQTLDTDLYRLIGLLSPDPVDTSIGFSLEKYESDHRSELPYLINPYLDNPETVIAYKVYEGIEQVKAIAKDPSSPLTWQKWKNAMA